MADRRQGHNDAHPTRGQGHKVRILVAIQPIETGPLAVGAHDAVAVKDHAVKQVEDVARDDRAERHEAPVLAEAVDAERLGDDGGEDAKEKAVAEPREARDEAEQVGILDAEGAKLGDAEDETGNDEAPRAVGVQSLDEEVGSNA